MIQKDDRILLLIAHPDDESMFFMPALLSLEYQLNCIIDQLNILCLTHGNDIRKKELKNAMKDTLGVTNITVIDDADLPDSSILVYDSNKIQKLVYDYVKEHKINKIITFDRNGISGHKNHSACYTSIVDSEALLKTLPTYEETYLLLSVPFLVKYSSFIGGFLYAIYYNIYNPFAIINFNLIGIILCAKAMIRHKTQLKYFRVLWIIFSCYSSCNVLVPLSIEKK